MLAPTVAFVSLSLFNILRVPLNLLPMMVSYVVMASVSVKRLVTFFKTADIKEDNLSLDDDCGTFTNHTAHHLTVQCDWSAQ